LGIIDLILIVLLLLAIYSFSKRRGIGLAILVILVIVVILIERLAPGALASLGTAIRGIDRVNDAGPHLSINPIVSFK
jgi:hypothetical protein